MTAEAQASESRAESEIISFIVGHGPSSDRDWAARCGPGLGVARSSDVARSDVPAVTVRVYATVPGPVIRVRNHHAT